MRKLPTSQSLALAGGLVAALSALAASGARAQPVEALVLPPAPPPSFDDDAGLVETAANLTPYRLYRVEGPERPSSAFDFGAPQALRLPPPPSTGLVTSAVEAGALQGGDPTSARRVSGALSVAPPPTQVWRLKADLDVQAGDRPDPAVSWPTGLSPSLQSPWRKLGGAVAAGVSPTSWSAVDLAVDRSLEVQDLPARADGALAQNSREAQQAVLALSLSPLSAVRLGVSAQAAAAADTVADSSAAGSTISLRTGETSAAVSAAWTVTPSVRLEASDREGFGDATWRQTAGASQGYAVSEPQVAATLAPWSGAQWRLSFGHAVSALDLGAFATVAEGLQRAADLGAGVRLAPNQEWRTQAELRQALPGAASLGVTLTDAQLDTTQELARSLDGTDLPVSIAGGQRRQLDVRLSTPLTPLAPMGFTVETAATVRDSQIVDPVTGVSRRLSGEAPYDASVTLAQDLAPLALRWGVLAHAQAAQIFYTPEETSTAAAAQSLGMFVEYHPAPFALRLQVDGLAGGVRDITDAVYDGSRDSDRIVHIDHRLDGGPAFSLVLKKAL